MEKRKKRLTLLLSLLFLLTLAIITSSSMENQTQLNNVISNHFVLVHGSGLGAWTWFRMVPLLQSVGYTVTALELAASGINLMRVDDVNSLTDFSKPLLDFMASLPLDERVILVGHSLGGGPISLAMELFSDKIQTAVFLVAYMPGPSLSFYEIFLRAVNRAIPQLDNNATYGNGPNNPPTILQLGPKFISQVVYQYSPREDAALATLLVRPQRVVTGEELVFTEARYGSVKRVFIIADGSRIIPIDEQQYIIQRNPPSKVFTILGSDHMPMSSQPAQLLTYLLLIAKDLA